MTSMISKIVQLVEDPYQTVAEFKKQTNKKVIGCFPMEIPEELVYAAGFYPVVIWVGNEPVTVGHSYTMHYNCAIVRTFVDDIVRDKLWFMDGVIIARQCLPTHELAFIIERNVKLPYHILNTGSAHWETVKECLSKTLESSNLGWNNLSYIVATGYGRKLVDFANLELTEISCCAYGVAKIFPSVKMIIDIGGQDSKIIHVGYDGSVVNFVLNDKCAAGTGRFLELIACSLGIPVEDLGKFASQSTKIVEVSNVCAVFAESEVISLRDAGVDQSRYSCRSLPCNS